MRRAGRGRERFVFKVAPPPGGAVRTGRGILMMLGDIGDFADRIRPIGVLYIDVHPFRVSASGDAEFLVLRRGAGIPLAGQWQTVSGKIRKGERIADAFARQVLGKTGRRPAQLFKLAEVTTFFDEYYDTVMMVPAAAARLDGPVEFGPTRRRYAPAVAGPGTAVRRGRAASASHRRIRFRDPAGYRQPRAGAMCLSTPSTTCAL
jgi:8-oxo-dGTP pyrophosphatase MutT (NUDIX family)